MEIRQRRGRHCIVTGMPRSGGKLRKIYWHCKDGVDRADRKMQLLEDLSYIDPSGQEWKAPKDSIIDGASIPSVLWSFVGSPFTGEYRDASVVHDVACVERTRPWRSVHRMFYYASRLRGVGEIKAKIMYAAVRKFGPRWDRQGEAVPMAPISEARMSEDFEALKQFIERENPGLERIEEVAEQ